MTHELFLAMIPYLGIGILASITLLIISSVLHYYFNPGVKILSRRELIERITELEETIRELRRTIEHKTHLIHGCVLDDIEIRTRLVQSGIQEYDEYGHFTTMMMLEKLIEQKDHSIEEVCRLLREQTIDHMKRKGDS